MGVERGSNFINAREPLNFVYPYLSKRKVAAYEETINQASVTAVDGTLRFLYSKIDRISNPALPANERYFRACDNIPGFRVTTTHSGSGKKAAFVIDNQRSIPLDSMGEGIPNILGLVADLCIAEGKLFLIEEPENDIHPKALKGLLRMIVESAESNQFVITTHSHIVVNHLGAEKETRVLSVSLDDESPVPASEVEEASTQDARRTVLASLGYELTDVNLWNAWLILEESSAERLVRDHLIR